MRIKLIGYVFAIAGNKKIVMTSNLKLGKTKSCGCSHKKYNKYDLTSEYGIGYTFKGEKFYFDKEDYNLLKEYCWCMDGRGYLITAINGKPIKQHRLIMNILENHSKYIDHKNGIRNQNNKSNLRIVTPQQNVINRKISSNNTSGITGVIWVENRKKWRAYIYYNRKNISLGSFANIEDAIQARKEAEIKYFGEYRYKGGD